MKTDWAFFFWDLLQYSLNGLAQGSLYALLALGYTLVYGIIRLVNFAHGEFLMIGSMCGFYMATLHMPMPFIFLAAGISAGIMAVLVERIIYRPIRHQGKMSALISAIGTSLFFQYMGQILFGAQPRSIPPFLTEQMFNIGEISLTNIQMVIFVTTIVIMLFLWLLINHTVLGKAMRATSFNLAAAELMGINTNLVISFTFFLGAFIAGISGILLATSVPIEPLMGTSLGMKAFVSAVVGGIGSIPGAFIGGILVGVLENLVAGLYKNSLRDGVSFFLLILILLIKPSGLFGKSSKEKV